MPILTFFIGMLLLSLSLKIFKVSTLLKLLGLKEDANLVFLEGLAISILAFIFILTAEPQMVPKPPGLNTFVMD